MTESFAGLHEIGQIAIPVQDVERASAFYRDQLGMHHLFTTNGLAFFRCGGVRLLLSRPEGVEANHSSVIYYKVSDINEAVTTMRERGVQFDDEPHVIAEMDDHTLWMAFLHDSEGNVLGLMSEVPRP